MNDMGRYFSEIIGLLPKNLYKKDLILNGDTRLQSDLGIYGDDAIEFIETFSDKFGVDISQFNVDKYFRQEGFDPFYPLKKFLKIEKSLPELTISDLEIAIENKRLV